MIDINTLLTTTPIERSSAATPLPSVVHSSVQFIALLSSVLTGLLLVLCTVTFVLICAAVTLQRKHKKGANNTHCGYNSVHVVYFNLNNDMQSQMSQIIFLLKIILFISH